jgi:hypothetical protein
MPAAAALAPDLRAPASAAQSCRLAQVDSAAVLPLFRGHDPVLLKERPVQRLPYGCNLLFAALFLFIAHTTFPY